IGKSGLITTDLSLGTMLFGEESGRSTPEADAKAIMQYYLAEGGNHIDTANVYAGGRSEEIIGRALEASQRKRVILATKVRFPMGEDHNQAGLSRLHIIEAVHDSLRRLQTDYIDLLYVHAWDPITPIQETLRALDDIVTSGKVRYLGVSNFKAWQVMKAQGLADQLGMHKFIAGQYQYSLVKRDLEYEFVDLFESEGLGLLPWGPLGGGFLTGKYQRTGPTAGRISITEDHTEESWERRNTEQNWQILDYVQDLAKQHQVTPSQVALAWLRAKQVVSSVILGARTLDQLKDNMGAAKLNLSQVEIAHLDELSKLPELYPYRMLEAYAQRKL
ncbi:MAG: aldo/keto reductase, partial [Bacteroidota bacterium]